MPVNETAFTPNSIETVLCDLDGVVWLAHEPIPGSVDAIADVRASGRRVLFVTNNSAATMAEHIAALESIGVPARGDVLSAAGAAAGLIKAGERVLITGGPGVVEAVTARGAEAVLNDGTIHAGDPIASTFDAVVVGLHRDFDYGRLASATAVLHGGARLIGTNSDSTYPTTRGLEPGGGSILAAVAAAAGQVPTIAGKPHQPTADLVRRTLGRDDSDRTHSESQALMVGDRPETDGLLARRIGCPFAMVRSGVNGADIDLDGFVPELDVADLAAVASALLG